MHIGVKFAVSRIDFRRSEVFMDNLIIKTREKVEKESRIANLFRFRNVKRKIMTLAVAGAMLTAGMFSACSLLSETNDPTNNGQANNEQNNNNNNNDNTQGGNENIDTPVTQYSGILNAVLNDEYYDSVLDNYREENKNRITNLESPIPYAFLEREGYDIDAIKSGELSCETVAYTVDGDTTRLYISTQPESKAGYYGNYILSYPLTEEEYEDLYMLHNEEYIQAGLFIQELDNQKRATVESHIDVENATFEGVESSFKKAAQEYIGLGDATIDVVYVNDDCEFTLNVRSKQSDGGSMISKTGLYIAECYSTPFYFTYETNYFKLSDPSSFIAHNLEQFQTKAHDLTYFNSQGKLLPNLSLDIN